MKLRFGFVLLLILGVGCGDDDASDVGPDVTTDAVDDVTMEARVDAEVGQEIACPDPGTPPELPERIPPLPGPNRDCGSPTFAPELGLMRHPYLQNVTPTDLRIAFTTLSEGDTTVRVFDTDESVLEFRTTGEVFDVAKTGANEDYVAHVAHVQGLRPGEAYCYEIAQGDSVLASGLRFDTAWENRDRPIRILTFGDSGDGSDEQLAVRDEFMTREFDLFLHLGDMAYGSGTYLEFETRMFDVYRDILHRVPQFPTIGNHEYKTRRGEPYVDVYHLPEVALNPDHNERYYSFDYGNVHFVSIDSDFEHWVEPVLGNIPEDHMVRWLEDDLASSDAEWKIAFFHHPPYHSSERGMLNYLSSLLVPLLEAGGVDLTLAGHEHHYERTMPILADCPSPQSLGAITHIVAGAGGGGVRPAAGGWFTEKVNSERNSFVSINITGCIADIEAVDLEGTVIDSFSLNGCD